MKEFYALMDHMKSLYENGMYEDVKLVADLLLGVSSDISSSSSNSTNSSTSVNVAGGGGSSSVSTASSMSPQSSNPSATASASMVVGATTSSSSNVTPSTSMTSAAVGTSSSQSATSGSFASVPFQCDSRDKYMIYYWHGNAAFHLKEYKLAESLFNKALLINNKSHLRPKLKSQLNSLDSDTDMTIKYNLHLCLMYEKRFQEAYVLLDSIPSKQRSLKCLLALGKLCQMLGHNKDAVGIYKEVLRLSKFSIVAIEALLSLGVKPESIPKPPANMSPDWLNAYLKGKNHMIVREYKDAVKVFKTIDSNLTHKSVDVLCSLAYSQYLNGEYSNAISTFEKLHKLEPTYTNKMDVYAFLLYSDKSEYDKLQTLERLANDMHQVSVTIPETWTVIGYYSLKKKSQKAKCFAESALQLDRDNTQALLLRAAALAKMKATMDAAVTYREATRFNSYFFEAYRGLVEQLLSLNHFKEAIQMAAAAIKLVGTNHRTLALYGEALSRESSTQEKSKSYLYKALKGDPDNQEAVLCLVRVCMTLQQFNEALEVLGKYLRHNSGNTRLLHIYSELMKKCSKTDDALIFMNKASGMDPGNVQIKTILERTEQSIEISQDESMPNFI